MKLLLTRRQAADALSVSVDTLERLIKTAEIKPIRIGRSVRVPVSEISALLERHQAAMSSCTGEQVRSDPESSKQEWCRDLKDGPLP